MRYLVDTNLLVGHSTRILLACLAEYGGHQLILTPDVQTETLRTIANRSRSKAQAQQRQTHELDGFNRWVDVLTRGGCLAALSPEQFHQYLDRQLPPNLQIALEIAWNDPDRGCDPDDLHLAEAAIACGVDAVLSNNLYMDGPPEQGRWEAIMQAVMGEQPSPSLYRQDTVVEQLMQAPDLTDQDRGQILLSLIVSTMTPTTDYKTPLVYYAKRIKNFFPRTAQALVEAVAQTSQATLQTLHRKTAELPLTHEIASESRIKP